LCRRNGRRSVVLKRVLSKLAFDTSHVREARMTQYGTLRVWAAVLTFFGTLSFLAAVAGTIVWAIEVDGVRKTLGVVLIGAPVSVFLATMPIALAQALRALADVGDTVAAR